MAQKLGRSRKNSSWTYDVYENRDDNFLLKKKSRHCAEKANECIFYVSLFIAVDDTWNEITGKTITE